MSEPVKCPYCFKVYKNYKSFHRHKTVKHSETIQSAQQRFDDYTIKPNYCKHCNSPLPYHQRHNKFCAHSCSASFNNHARPHKPTQALYKYKATICKVTFCKCETCGVTYRLTSGRNPKFCSMYCNPEFYKKTSYRSQCKFQLSPVNHPSLFDSTLIESLGWYTPTNSTRSPNLTGVCWDHLYRISDGYKNRVDPSIMSHPANAELVPWPVNITRKQSLITYKQLLERIDQWDSGNFNLSYFYILRGALE